MKLAIAVIIALIGSMAMADQVGKVCPTAASDAGSYWDGKACTKCPTGCLECVWKNNAVSCLKCESATNYLKVVNEVGTCEKCVDNCAACKGPSAADCITPNTDYLVNPNPSSLVKCTTKDCLYCGTENKCAKCTYGFFVDASNNCVACGQNCASCTSASACTKCTYKSALNNGSCTVCGPACNECPCKTCTPGFSPVTANGTTTCERCNDTLCADCSANKDQCKSCGTGSGKKDGKCTVCTVAGCSTCADDNSKCTACQDKKGLKDNTCVDCPTNCNKCDGSGTCTDCQTGFYKTADNKECKLCSGTCTECNNDGTCKACADGYIFSEDKKTCAKCVENCKTCANVTACTTCTNGFTAVDGVCKDPSVVCKAGQQMDTKGACFNGTLDNCVFGTNSSCVTCAKAYYYDGKACSPCQPGCDWCVVSPTGYLTCMNVAQKYFSRAMNTNAKKDNTGYLGNGGVATVTYSNKASSCLPNWLLTEPLQDITNTECDAYDTCPFPYKNGAEWHCHINGKGNNGFRVAVSFFAMAVAAIFAL